MKSNYRGSFWLCVVGALAVGTGCGSDWSKVGGETSFLSACDHDSDCGRGSCYCHVCTLECDGDSDCDVMVGASCTSPLANPGRFECEQQRSICLPMPDPETFGEAASFRESYTAYRATLPVLGECEKNAPYVLLRMKEGDGNSLTGQVWLRTVSPTDSPSQSLSGTADDELFIDATNVEERFLGSGGTLLEQFTVALSAMNDEQLAGILAPTSIVHSWPPDESEECALGGPLLLQRDDVRPMVMGSNGPISSSMSYTLFFSDILQGPVEAQLTLDGVAVPFTNSVLDAGDGFVQQVTLYPELGWSPGEYTVALGRTIDIGGNETAPQTVTFTVPKSVSATVDPSFENDNREGGWLGECAFETSFGATFDGEPRVLEASDGEKFAVCERALPFGAEVAPPAEATRVLIDAAAYWPNSSASQPFAADDVRRMPNISILYPQGGITMEPLEPGAELAPLSFRTFVATLPAPGVHFAISAIMETPGDWDNGAPIAFFDNLRFE